MNAARPDARVPSRPEGPPTGLTCPQCGGAVWEQASADTLLFRCRIGHQLSLGGMLAEHGLRRRTCLAAAGRQLAETAELNRRVAQWARAHGHVPAAQRLEQEAAALDQQAEAVLRLATAALLPTSGEG
jgi:two-component system, chemotaxis family, protein-glutamate methylesterase/glutaminase